MFASYWREYENFTQLPGESIDVMFQRFTCIVNNMRANVTVLPYDDHDRAIKLLHYLDLNVWSAKVEVIMESSNYETLTVDKLFSKLKSSEVDRGLRGKTTSPSDHHTLALVLGHEARTNAKTFPQLSLSCLVSVADEEFDVLSEDDLTLLTRRFERLTESQRNSRRNSGTCFGCGNRGHFFVECPDAADGKNKNDSKHKHKKDRRPWRS